MHHQFFKISYAPIKPCPLEILVSDFIFSILAGNKKKYNIVLNEFETWPDCGVSCP